MHRLISFIFLCITLALHIYTPVFAKSKAQYLLDFSHFVTWSSNTSEEQFNICLYGSNPFGSSLHNLVKDKRIQGKVVSIMQQNSLQNLSKCHILYVNSSSKSKINAILKLIANKPILTVSNFDGFIEAGGIINFTEKEGATRFKINVKAMKKANLRISSKLIRLAVEVIQ